MNWGSFLLRIQPDLNTLHVPTLWNTQLSTHLIGSFRIKLHFNFIATTADPFNYCLKFHSSLIHPIFHNKRSTSRLLNSVWVTKKYIMERKSTSLRAIVLLYCCNVILLDCQCKVILSRALPVPVQEKFLICKARQSSYLCLFKCFKDVLQGVIKLISPSSILSDVHLDSMKYLRFQL